MPPPLNGGKIKSELRLTLNFMKNRPTRLTVRGGQKKLRELFKGLAGGSRQSHGLFVLKKTGT